MKVIKGRETARAKAWGWKLQEAGMAKHTQIVSKRPEVAGDEVPSTGQARGQSGPWQ